MSNDAGGFGTAGQPPGYPPPGYPPAGYTPPGYRAPRPTDLRRDTAIRPDQGALPGYPPPGYNPPPAMSPALKPGVIPLRPLTLTDIFNGAVAYIRANPKATLGFTTIVVVATQLLALVLSVGPLAVTGDLFAVVHR